MATQPSPIDIIIFAPLAPILGVLLFWFIQLLFIESHKYLLSKIWDKHQPLCRFTNFIGILFQTICHALGYTVTRSGISNFYISVDYGRVAPKREKKGVFEWLSNTFLFVGPFFLPASLLLLALYFLLEQGMSFSTPVTYTFSEGLINFGVNLFHFTEGFLTFLVTIDLLHPGHLGFFILLLFLGMGIRPSYIGQEKKEKVDMIYDLKNIQTHLLRRPLYLLVLFLLAYILSYVSLLFHQNWYEMIFTLLGWLSIIAIISLLIAHLLILLVRITDDIPGYWHVVPYLILPSSYILMRAVLFFVDIGYKTTISLGVTLLSTVLVIILLLKYKTNKFKTKTSMKPLKVEDDQGKRRDTRK